jgi:hypothetical protein
MRIDQLAAKTNLELAWRRITTGGNTQYKRFYRHIYYAYEVALNDNLEDLRHRLSGGTFEPSPPERIYLPKSSGLHRPLSLLNIEDQIVLQAFANLAAKRLHKKRRPLQFKVIFSNILENDTSIFFFRQWQFTYSIFKRKTASHYKAGLRWVADFDLAAFYDTISHELLLKTIYPRTPVNGDMEWLLRCLRTWSSERATSCHGHGIPQGPIASNFLAECFLLPIDLALKKYEGYTRYVDDVRLFGRSEDEVRAMVIELERHCRERGLIPQSGKFAIKRAQSVQDATGMMPSLADPQRTEGSNTIPNEKANQWFLSAISGKPYKVIDKTRLRYVLYRAEPNQRLLELVLRLVPHHPEHADAFFCYLANFDFRKPIFRLCLNLIHNSPYPYIRGEAWHILARYFRKNETFPEDVRRDLMKRSVNIAQKRRSDLFMEKWGACHFLAVADMLGGSHYSRFFKFQPSLLQSMLSQVLPDTAFDLGEAADQYLRRTDFEPGLSICSKIHGLGLSLQTFGLQESEIPSQVRNTLCQLGIIQSRGSPVDPIAEVLQSKYGVYPSKSWHQLLGAEYVHSLGLLKQAEAAFNSELSFWLAYQNSFNHAIFLALQTHLNSIQHATAIAIHGRNGHLIDFGVMLDSNNCFSRNCSCIADCFRNMNTRRNHLPVSHPYEKKTAIRCNHLKVQERNHFVNQLRTAYPAFVVLMP